jgi:hypothetical protein
MGNTKRNLIGDRRHFFDQCARKWLFSPDRHHAHQLLFRNQGIVGKRNFACFFRRWLFAQPGDYSVCLPEVDLFEPLTIAIAWLLAVLLDADDSLADRH